MVLILPRVTLIEELGFFPEMPEYLFERAFRIFAVASSMVSPESCMGAYLLNVDFPFGSDGPGETGFIQSPYFYDDLISGTELIGQRSGHVLVRLESKALAREEFVTEDRSSEVGSAAGERCETGGAGRSGFKPFVNGLGPGIPGHYRS